MGTCIIGVFFFNDTATTEIYTLSLHDALPICGHAITRGDRDDSHRLQRFGTQDEATGDGRGSAERTRRPDLVSQRSEEHTSELQSRQYLVCRLLLEKKKRLLHPLAIPARSSSV